MCIRSSCNVCSTILLVRATCWNGFSRLIGVPMLVVLASRISTYWCLPQDPGRCRRQRLHLRFHPFFPPLRLLFHPFMCRKMKAENFPSYINFLIVNFEECLEVASIRSRHHCIRRHCCCCCNLLSNHKR